MACTVAELTDRFAELIATQYGGVTAAILDEAAEKGLPVSFAVYPDDTYPTEASLAQYELDLYGISADSVGDFATQLAKATHDLYVTELGVNLAAEDIYCVDVIS